MRLVVSHKPTVPAIDAVIEGMKRGVTRAVRKTTRDLKLDLRGQTRPVLGPRIANAWREKTYPDPPKTSINAAGQVYSRAPKIIDAWERGTPIRARRRRFLAIPLPNAPKRVRGKRVSPARMMEAGWTLRVVRTRTGKLMLVGTNATVTKVGRIRRSGKRAAERGHVAWVPLFALVQAVRFPKVFDLKRSAAIAHVLLAARIEASLRG